MSYIKTIFCFTIFLIVTSCGQTSQAPINESGLSSLSKARTSFVEWGKKNITSFQLDNIEDPNPAISKIAEDIGDSKVVVISEGFHNCEEMLTLQYQLIQHLVTTKGFNTIVTESGLPESKNINDYIHGETPVAGLWKNSIGKMYSEWEMGRKTINWLREHNQSNNNQVNYYGADIGGFYNDWDFPFQQIFAYLSTVDPVFNKKLKQQLTPFLKLMKNNARPNYIDKLSLKEKHNLAFILDELITTFNSNKNSYISKSSEAQYSWIFQCVYSMNMAENYYKNYIDSNNPYINRYVGLNGREIAMAENVKWTLSQRKDAKVILINHVVHTKTESQLQEGLYGNFTPMGQRLKQHLKDDIFIIGMVYGEGKFWNNWTTPSERYIDNVPPPIENGLEEVMKEISAGDYYLNWGKAPENSYRWFNDVSIIGENNYSLKIRPAEWDACFYLNSVSPAKPYQ